MSERSLKNADWNVTKKRKKMKRKNNGFGLFLYHHSIRISSSRPFLFVLFYFSHVSGVLCFLLAADLIWLSAIVLTCLVVLLVNVRTLIKKRKKERREKEKNSLANLLSVLCPMGILLAIIFCVVLGEQNTQRLPICPMSVWTEIRPQIHTQNSKPTVINAHYVACN